MRRKRPLYDPVEYANYRKKLTKRSRRKYRLSPRGKYNDQKQNAKRRGIAWEISFADWWQIWQDSGHWKQRGKSAGCYCMARIRDVGPYKKGNVIIVKLESNAYANLILCGRSHLTSSSAFASDAATLL